MRAEDIVDYFKLKSLLESPWRTVRFRKCNKPGETLVMNFHDGRRASLRGGYADYHMFHRIFMRDEYRVREAQPKAWGCILDLGGNVGLFSLYVSRIAHRVYCFEPLRENYELLRANTASCPNVSGFCEAIAGTAGTLRLFHPSNVGLSGTYSAFEDVTRSDARFEDVPAVTLNQILEREGIAHCDLLKIDVEGQEYDILYGCRKDVFEKIDRIHGEYHNVSPENPRTRIAKFSSFLREWGYVVEVVPHRRKENFGMFFASKPHTQHT